MSATDSELLKELRAIVVEHYDNDSSPLLLSELGHRLQQRDLWPPKDAEGKTLRQIIEGAKDSDLQIIRNKDSPAYIAVATNATKELVEQWMARRSQVVGSVPSIEDLPRSVLLAFCVPVEADQQVFVEKSAPFKYVVGTAEEIDLDKHIEVARRYRRPGLNVSSPAGLNASDRLDLQTRIAAWSRDMNIPIVRFQRRTAVKPVSALERLLAVQPPGIAEKIVIPGDIALLLSRRE